MSNRNNHPAVDLLNLVKAQDLTRSGDVKPFWRAAWFPVSQTRCRVSIFSPHRQSKEQAVETIIALTSSGCPGVIVDECVGTTRFDFLLPITPPVRIEEDEQGYPRIIAMPLPSYVNPFGGDVA